MCKSCKYPMLGQEECQKRGWCKVCETKGESKEYSESAWKSLAIKSLRIGWVQGMEEADKHLNKSTMEAMLIGGLFEDVFPAGYEELEEALQEIRRRDYLSLCSRDTHHGRGYTEQFCNMEREAVMEGKLRGKEIMQEVARHTSLKWINPRVYNCLYTWWKISPQDVESKREPFLMEWKEMPSEILDSHTYEGKVAKRGVTLLSGHYFNHRKIGRIVQSEGWEGFRGRLAF